MTNDELLEDALLFVSKHIPMSTSLQALQSGEDKIFKPSARALSACLSDYVKLIEKVDPRLITAFPPLMVATEVMLVFLQIADEDAKEALPPFDIFALLKVLHAILDYLGPQIEPFSSLANLLEERITA